MNHLVVRDNSGGGSSLDQARNQERSFTTNDGCLVADFGGMKLSKAREGGHSHENGHA